MAYRLEAITLCTRGPVNTSAMRELWGDIEQGKLPILFDSEHNFQQGISPIYQYSNYAQNDFDLSGNWPSVKSCVSDFRQSQDWCSGNSAESGLKPFHTYGPGGGRYARRRRECRPKRRDNLSSGLSQWPGRRT